MRRAEKAIIVGGSLVVAAIALPLVVLVAGMQDWVAQTAAEAGTAPLTHYGEIGVISYIVVWVLGAVLGSWWIFKPDRQLPAGKSN
jgi:hypothetical protein